MKKLIFTLLVVTTISGYAQNQKLSKPLDIKGSDNIVMSATEYYQSAAIKTKLLFIDTKSNSKSEFELENGFTAKQIEQIKIEQIKLNRIFVAAEKAYAGGNYGGKTIIYIFDLNGKLLFQKDFDNKYLTDFTVNENSGNAVFILNSVFKNDFTSQSYSIMNLISGESI